MKNECYIVRDLLPSYIDQLCSEESSRFVEQHIDTCDQCTQLLEQMRAEFDTKEQPEIPDRIEQKKPFQKVSHFFNAQKNFTFFFFFLKFYEFFKYFLLVCSHRNGWTFYLLF